MSEDKKEDGNAAEGNQSMLAKIKGRFTSALVKAEFRVLVDLRKSYENHAERHPEKTTERQIIQDRIDRSAKFLARSIDKRNGQDILEKELNKLDDDTLKNQIIKDLKVRDTPGKEVDQERPSGPKLR